MNSCKQTSKIRTNCVNIETTAWGTIPSATSLEYRTINLQANALSGFMRLTAKQRLRSASRTTASNSASPTSVGLTSSQLPDSSVTPMDRSIDLKLLSFFFRPRSSSFCRSISLASACRSTVSSLVQFHHQLFSSYTILCILHLFRMCLKSTAAD